MATERNGFPMEYIGDGVYASFDGYQVWLHVGSHEAPPIVALEPPVIDALNAYYRSLFKQPSPDIAPVELDEPWF